MWPKHPINHSELWQKQPHRRVCLSRVGHRARRLVQFQVSAPSCDTCEMDRIHHDVFIHPRELGGGCRSRSVWVGAASVSPGLSAAHLSRPRTPSTVRTETETHQIKPKISSAFRGCSSSSEPSGPTGPTFHFLGVRQRRTLLKLVETQPGRDTPPSPPPRPQEILRTHQKLW